MVIIFKGSDFLGIFLLAKLFKNKKVQLTINEWNSGYNNTTAFLANK